MTILHRKNNGSDHQLSISKNKNEETVFGVLLIKYFFLIILTHKNKVRSDLGGLLSSEVVVTLLIQQSQVRILTLLKLFG